MSRNGFIGKKWGLRGQIGVGRAGNITDAFLLYFFSITIYPPYTVFHLYPSPPPISTTLLFMCMSPFSYFCSIPPHPPSCEPAL